LYDKKTYNIISILAGYWFLKNTYKKIIQGLAFIKEIALNSNG